MNKGYKTVNIIDCHYLTFSDLLNIENGELKMTLFPGGYMRRMMTEQDKGGPMCQAVPHYYLKDYLGNNREVVRDESFTIWTTTQRTEYTPFGVPYPQTVGDAGEQPFKFSGKEWDRMHGLNYYDFHARMYDPVLISFLTADPLAEKYYGISPYVYCGNNPVNNVDPNGKDIIVLHAPTGAHGAGHSAILIGNDKDGWTYISKDGSKWLPSNGPSKHTNTKETKEKITSEEDFDKSGYALNGGHSYTQRIKITTTKEQDNKAINAADRAAKRWYSLTMDNCIDAVSDALAAAGLNPGYTWYETFSGEFVTDKNPIPNMRIKKIAKDNNAEIYDVNLPIMQEKREDNNKTTWNDFLNTLNYWLNTNPDIKIIIH